MNSKNELGELPEGREFTILFVHTTRKIIFVGQRDSNLFQVDANGRCDEVIYGV